MSLTIGTRIGSYEVVAAIGAGGMGEVYKARDTKLNRDVALKILPDALASDPDRLARFEREAQVLASLSHPNIAAIFGVEDSGPTRALVLEFIDGPTLADRLEQGAVPLADALAIARQIADGLAAAHEAGVIHRDLKPANIKVRDDGTVKVLDFGLAKAMSPDPSSVSGTMMNSPTITARATEMGVVLGTAAYMAPEQARGKVVDRRADLWAFGVVLYEMLTGRRAFEGPEVSDVLAAVLRDTPSLDHLPSDVPQGVRRLLRRTLEKDRARRLDSMAAARLELDDTDTSGDAARAAVAPTRRRSILVPVLAASVLAALAAGGLVWRAMQPAPPEVLRFSIAPTPDAPIAIETNHNDIAIAPDGSAVFYFSRRGAENQFVMRPLNRFDSTVLQNLGDNSREVNISADGKWIAYQAGGLSGSDATLFKTPMTGGVPTRLCAVPGNLRGATWISDNTMVFATISRREGLMSVPSAGGTFTVLTTPNAADGEIDHLWPRALPDGKHVLFAISRAGNRYDIGLLDVGTGTWRVLIKDGLSAHYSATGHIIYGLAGVLKAVPFDLARLQVTGEPVQVLAGVTTKPSGAANFDISRDGTLVYLPGDSTAIARQLAWRDSSGTEKPLALAPADYSGLKVSPDGRFAAAVFGATAGNADSSELRVIDLVREVPTTITPKEFGAATPVWSPDNRRLAFSILARPAANEPGGLFVVSASGTSAPERLTTALVGERHVPSSWTTADTILFTNWTAGNSQVSIKQISLTTKEVKTVLAEPSGSQQPALSPDGHWLAYASPDPVVTRVFVRPFPNVDDQKIPVAEGSGSAPAWSNDGRLLYYRGSAGQEYVVSITRSGGSITIGRPTAVRESAGSDSIVAFPPVGDRVLMATQITRNAVPTEYRVVLNWFEELKARVAGGGK